MTILYYWQGSKNNKLAVLKKKWNEIGYDVEVGPSSSEHKKLMNESRLYKESYENNNFAFASDIWRCIKLEQGDYIFFDVSIDINFKTIGSLLKEVQGKDIFLVREDTNILECSPAYGNNKDIWRYINDLYSKSDVPHAEVMFSQPTVFTLFLAKKFKLPMGFETLKTKSMYLLALDDAEKYFKHIGGGTWFLSGDKSNKKSRANSYWITRRDNYKNRIEGGSSKKIRLMEMPKNISDQNRLMYFYLHNNIKRKDLFDALNLKNKRKAKFLRAFSKKNRKIK